MKTYQLLICILLIASCSKDKTIESFTIQIENRESIHFENSECEFNNRQNQYHYSTTSGDPDFPSQYHLGATYSNIFGLDSVISSFSINLFIDIEPTVEQISPEYLELILSNENSEDKSKHFYPYVELRVSNESFSNRKFNSLLGGPKFNEDFTFRINDYEILYSSDCIEKDLLYLDITIGGRLDDLFFANPNPMSITLKEIQLKVLYDLYIR